MKPVFLQGPFKVRGAWQVRATVEDLCFRVRLRVALRVCPVHRRIDFFCPFRLRPLSTKS